MSEHEILYAFLARPFYYFQLKMTPYMYTIVILLYFFLCVTADMLRQLYPTGEAALKLVWTTLPGNVNYFVI